MSAGGDDRTLEALIERQFAHLFALKDTGRIIFITRLLEFIENEPRLSGILEDFRTEAEASIVALASADHNIRAELAALWSLHRQEISNLLAPALADDEQRRHIHFYGTFETFEQQLGERPEATYPATSSRAELGAETKRLISAFRHWATVASEASGGFALSDELEKLPNKLTALLTRHRFAVRGFAIDSRTLAWPAIQRLRGVRASTRPLPPANETELDSDFARFHSENPLAQVVHGEGSVVPDEVARFNGMVKRATADAATVREELLLRIGLGRSRSALVRRYAARCEAFDAERLRAACAADSRNAERVLTLDFARYLFDSGLTPLLDGTASGLRPDILHVEASSLFYVEAKQYDANPKSQLRRAYSQVWSTWGRLRKTYPCTEAFLVVFRRAGQYAELPSVIRQAGLRLHSVLVDISIEAGSREKSSMVTITEEDLQPTDSES